MIIRHSERLQRRLPAVFFGACAALLIVLSSPAQAELILGAEMRLTAEDSIVGLLAGSGDSNGTSGGAALAASSKRFGGGMGSGGSGGAGNFTGGGSQSPGDLSVTAAMEAGGSTEMGSLSFFTKGFAERTNYQKFSEYDSSIAGVAAGMTARLSDLLSMRISGIGKVRRYDNDPDRDGTGYEGTASLTQLVTNDLWLREAAEYETYRAAYQAFSYRGTTLRFGMGYDLTDNLLVTAGYRFQAQHYQDIAATALRTRTASIGPDYAFSDRWSAGLFYERETTVAGTSDVITRNNILSLSIRWYY